MPNDDASMLGRIAGAKTLLFVPGDRPDRFGKALASGADLVIIDLEDAVAPARKPTARELVRAWLSPERGVLLRINPVDTEWFSGDLELLDHAGVLGVVLPKAELGPGLDQVARIKPTLALIESARGLADVNGIAHTPGVVRLIFGTIDLALDLGLDTLPDTMLELIGTSLVVASRAARLAPPVDGVTPIFRNADAVAAAALHARRRGFGGKLCIHPAQVLPVSGAFRPDEQAIERALRIVAADLTAQGAAVAFDGQMIDRPIVQQAYRTLADAGLSVDIERTHP